MLCGGVKGDGVFTLFFYFSYCCYSGVLWYQKGGKALCFAILNNLILLIGFSYYAFQAIAYLADILLQKYKAEKNIGIFALYMSFFPKFVSEPIERCSTFMPQLKKLENVKFRDEYRLSLAFAYILYGYFMKVAVADNLGTLRQ